CLEIKDHSYTLKKQFTNTKKCCKDHFKKYKFFQQKYGMNEAQTIIDDTNSKATMQKYQRKRFHTYKDDNNRLSSYASSSVSIQAIDISSKRACTEEVKNKINEITKSIINKEIKVVAIVTNSHSSYTVARKQLQVENSQITYLLYFVYQTNLYIGKIFKESNIFKTTTLEATYIAVYLKSKQHTLIAQYKPQTNEKIEIKNDLFEQDVFGYWNWCLESIKELEFVASQIISICINAALVERTRELTNIIEQEQETNSKNKFQYSADLTKNNLEKITNSLLNAELLSDILLDHKHPQRDKYAK
ncbi:3642_t:CDS:2, partial [Scutellospora calospora]